MYIVGITFVFILLKQRRRGRHARARRVYCIGSNLIGFDDPSRSHACRLAFAAASHSALFTVPGNTPTRTRTRQYTSHTIHFIHVRASPRVAHRRVVVVVDRRRRRTSKHIRHVGGVETHPTGGEKRAERADQLSSTRTARHRRRQLPRPMRPTIVHPSRDDRSISIRSDREISSQLNLAVKGSCVRDRCVISIEHGTRGIESMGRRMSESRRSNDRAGWAVCRGVARQRATTTTGRDDDGDGARREWGFPCARPCVRRRERRADGRTID